MRGEAIRRRLDVDCQRSPLGESPYGGIEPLVGENRRVNSASKLPQLPQRALHLDLRFCEEGSGLRLRTDPRAQELQRHPDAEKTLLRSVVEVAFEAPSLLVPCPDDPSSGLT